MKTENYIQSLVKYSALSALTLSSSLFAIERPSPAVHPEEKVPAADQAIAMPEVQAQNLAFLGVFGEPISDTLSSHLNLAEGIGLELELVAGNSPAAEAGLKKHDIIMSLAGKDISTQDDLRASIADKKPGDEVTLNYISKGKSVSKKLTLGARPMRGASIAGAGQLPQHNAQPRADMEELALPKEFLNKFPEKDRERLKKLFQGRLKGLDLQELQQGMDKLEGFDFKLMPKGLNPNLNQGLKFKGGFNSRFKMLDNNGSVTLESTKDGKVIELLDKNGELQYRGPYNNEADKMSVPEDLRDRVKNLDFDIGFGFPKAPNIKQFEEKMDLHFGDIPGLKAIPNMQGIEKELQQMLQMPKILPNDNGANRLEFNFSNNQLSTTKTDPQTGNRYTFKKNDKSSQVEVYDPAGKLLYDGPYNTDADKASVPEEFSRFLEQMVSEISIEKK